MVRSLQLVVVRPYTEEEDVRVIDCQRIYLANPHQKSIHFEHLINKYMVNMSLLTLANIFGASNINMSSTGLSC